MAVVPAAPLNKLRAFPDEVLKGGAMNHRAEADDLDDHVFSLLQSPDRFLLPQIGNNQARGKLWSHCWKMFAVCPACNCGASAQRTLNFHLISACIITGLRWMLPAIEL